MINNWSQVHVDTISPSKVMSNSILLISVLKLLLIQSGKYLKNDEWRKNYELIPLNQKAQQNTEELEKKHLAIC